MYQGLVILSIKLEKKAGNYFVLTLFLLVFSRLSNFLETLACPGGVKKVKLEIRVALTA